MYGVCIMNEKLLNTWMYIVKWHPTIAMVTKITLASFVLLAVYIALA